MLKFLLFKEYPPWVLKVNWPEAIYKNTTHEMFANQSMIKFTIEDGMNKQRC